ncbi:MAG: hypothetical protein PHU53_07875 [Thermoplasmata archaeon]|nr:hypothetical protein [Thermoplasmata archaeon]
METGKKLITPKKLEEQMKLGKIIPTSDDELLARLIRIVNECLLSLPGPIHPDHPDENMRVAYIGTNAQMMGLWLKIGAVFVEKAKESGWEASIDDTKEGFSLVLKPIALSDDERRDWILKTLNGFGHSMRPWDQDGETTHFTMCRYCSMFVAYRDRSGASYRWGLESVCKLLPCSRDD